MDKIVNFPLRPRVLGLRELYAQSILKLANGLRGGEGSESFLHDIGVFLGFLMAAKFAFDVLEDEPASIICEQTYEGIGKNPFNHFELSKEFALFMDPDYASDPDFNIKNMANLSLVPPS